MYTDLKPKQWSVSLSLCQSAGQAHTNLPYDEVNYKIKIDTYEAYFECLMGFDICEDTIAYSHRDIINLNIDLRGNTSNIHLLAKS